MRREDEWRGIVGNTKGNEGRGEELTSEKGRRNKGKRSRSIRGPELARSNARIQFLRSFNHFECTRSLSSLLFPPFAFISFHILPSVLAYDSLRYLLAFAFSSAQSTQNTASSLTRERINLKNNLPFLRSRSTLNLEFSKSSATRLPVFHVSRAQIVKGRNYVSSFSR